MLNLIGLGFEKDDITLKALNAIKSSDEVYAEFYTNSIIDLNYLEELTNKKIKILDRNTVENQNKIAEASKTKNVSFLISGDPLAATTHFEIVHRIRKEKTKVQIFHNNSIFTSISETGLSIYKFGRTTTISKPEKNYFPTSPYDIINSNAKNNLHTLILFDIDLTAKEAANILKKMEEKKRNGLFKEKTKLIAAARLGTKDPKITYTALEDLIDVSDLGPTPHCLIYPSKLDHMEEVFLSEFRN